MSSWPLPSCGGTGRPGLEGNGMQGLAELHPLIGTLWGLPSCRPALSEPLLYQQHKLLLPAPLPSPSPGLTVGVASEPLTQGGPESAACLGPEGVDTEGLAALLSSHVQKRTLGRSQTQSPKVGRSPSTAGQTARGNACKGGGEVSTWPPGDSPGRWLCASCGTRGLGVHPSCAPDKLCDQRWCLPLSEQSCCLA